MDIIYMRRKVAKLLKDCRYNSTYEQWHRTLVFPRVGYEILDDRNVVAVVRSDGSAARPCDYQCHRSNDEIEAAIVATGFKVDTSGLFYVCGRYRTWDERRNVCPHRHPTE